MAMSRFASDRRRFLTLVGALFFVPALGRRGWASDGRGSGASDGAGGAARGGLAGAPAPVDGGPVERKSDYTADVAILYGALRFRVTGTITEVVDRAAGHYQILVEGQGTGIANRIESVGTLRDGRWTPGRASSWFQVAGREAKSEFGYDWQRRLVEYHYRGETFLLRRLRVADDVLRLPDGMHVDDVMSATLNYADGQWRPAPDGRLETHVVRRHRAPREDPDDVQASYHAELIPFTLRLTSDRESGKPTALFDMTRFSSWAREGQPARIVFGPARRPESIVSPLMLGTSVSVRMAAS